jgi:hypothetical protein
MIHSMRGEWEIKNIGPSIIKIPLLFPLIKYKNIYPQKLTLDDVSYKKLDAVDTNSRRFILADITYPLIAVENMPNPHGKRYRMIDGRHRLLKQINLGNSKFLFYILQYDDIKQFICKI